MQYGAEHADLYEIVFASRGKNFDREAKELADLVRARFPRALSLLDVACGTGAHLAAFGGLFEYVEGVDCSEDMLAVGRRKRPDLPLRHGDMRTFDLGRTFDAVVCLGNSVACMPTVEELGAAIRRMADHLTPGGVLIVEPWWFPDEFLDGHVGGHLVTEAGRVISRVTHAARRGDRTRHEVNFVVADASGIRTFTDVLWVSLFTREQYAAAFERAGCTVDLVKGLSLDTGRPNGPGLFVGTRR
ncbi:class I SAM-dependent DNA methyltransferase [Nocardia transvalensis]|uniref:class I SAM-dependent DNA methyltransferase n=1 Tax=Nocardia transvalensis TaxID=37333 RepID=UPI0018935C60|nr:class I SAM-dependent methyltransferase [Nocardia transvalensis]MBF6331903.1 class I SAM-dependent methyltransferase [Nocardia transvalensis]